MQNSIKAKLWPGLVLAGIVLVIYIFSLCPTLYLIDSGELATASFTLGIAHPTGYPLYTIISYFFARLGGEPIYNLNVLSALFAVLTCFMVYLLAKRAGADVRIAVLMSSLSAAASIMWRIAVTNEVYSLTALFIVTILYLSIHTRTLRDFFLLMYIIGIAFTNHIVVFAVALPVFLYTVIKFRISIKNVLIGIILSGLGVSLYLYLISRTAGGAEIAWGNTFNLQRLFWHMTGRQYQVWMFSLPPSEVFANLIRGLGMLFNNLFWIFLAPLVIGYYRLFNADKRQFWLLLSIPIINIAYAVNYSIPDIESYYLPALFAFITVTIYGLKALDRWLKWYIVIPLVILMFGLNYNRCTQRNNYFGEEFALAHLEQMPVNSLLICTYWDVYSPIMYMREVRHFREDLIVIDKELLRRTWYIKYLKQEYPAFYEQVRDRVNAFLTELEKFEYGRQYDPYTIQTRYTDMLNAFVRARQDRAFIALPYPDRDLEQALSQYHRIPRGLNFQVIADPGDYDAIDYRTFKITYPDNVNDQRLVFNAEYVGQMINNNINYFRSTGNIKQFDEASDWQKRYKKD